MLAVVVGLETKATCSKRCASSLSSMVPTGVDDHTLRTAAACLYVTHYCCCLLLHFTQQLLCALTTAAVCSYASRAGYLRGGESRPGSPGAGGGALRRGDLARSGGCFFSSFPRIPSEKRQTVDVPPFSVGNLCTLPTAAFVEECTLFPPPPIMVVE